MTNEMTTIITNKKGKPLFEINKKKMWIVVITIIIGIGLGLAFLLGIGGIQ